MLFACIAVRGIDFKTIEAKFIDPANYAECKKELNAALAQAAPGKEKYDVLWHLSELNMLIGQYGDNKDAKRAAFTEGIKCAEQAMKEYPSGADSYMWRCANTGRRCQLGSLKEQMNAVDAMLGDLSTILDKQGKTNRADAWQALAEIYFNHPFKSNDAAINFTRAAVDNMPKGNFWIITYTLLAKLLYDRDNSADRRAGAITKNASKWASAKGNIEKYTFYDGSFAKGYKTAWAPEGIAKMSDRQEAKAIFAYVKGVYKTLPKNKMTETDFKTFADMAAKWK